VKSVIREFMTRNLDGDITNYEGRPTDSQSDPAPTRSATSWMTWVKQLDELTSARTLTKLNESLRKKKLDPNPATNASPMGKRRMKTKVAAAPVTECRGQGERID